MSVKMIFATVLASTALLFSGCAHKHGGHGGHEGHSHGECEMCKKSEEASKAAADKKGHKDCGCNKKQEG